MANEYYTGSVIDIKLDPAPHDITAADSVLILYRRPDGTTGEWVASKFGSLIRFITDPTDIPSPGWIGTTQLQACAVYGSERKYGKYCYMTLKAPIS